MDWWFEALVWRGVLPPQGVTVLRVIMGDVHEALVAGEGCLEGFRCHPVEGACIGPDPGGGGCPGVGFGLGGGRL